MVNRINRDTARNIPSTIDQETTANTGYSHNPSVSRKTRINDYYAFDEVIAHLANAHENRRARQVSEWERMPRQFVH